MNPHRPALFPTVRALTWAAGVLLLVPDGTPAQESRAVADPLAVAAPPAPPPLGTGFHRGRRLELMKRVKTGVILVRGSAEPDNYLPLIQNHQFFYLTGVRDPDCELILLPETGEEILLVPPRSPFTESWIGPRLYPGDKAKAATGFSRVDNARALKRLLEECLDKVKDKTIHIPLEPEVGRSGAMDNASGAAQKQKSDEFDGRASRAEALADALKRVFPDATVHNIASTLDAMRVIKTPEEIEALRYTCKVAALGVNEAMRSVRPGLYERQIAAAADFVFQREGSQALSYNAICGSGPNACVLHYMNNDRIIQDGELVLLDFAPDCGGYVSDLTRTFPANGRWTQEQRKLYEDVLAAQEAVFKIVKPGARFADLEAAASGLLRGRGYKPGIELKHGCCHFVGLAVHDVGDYGLELEPGMVFTVEPGAYYTKKAMGVRIEDVVLVTADGYELLTKDAPRDPDAIAKLIAEKGVLDG